MNAHLRKLVQDIGDSFWLVPSGMVLAGALTAMLALMLDNSSAISQRSSEVWWLYGGGATGARSLLGAVASSTITVAGTVFSITIAALSLAAGQMGPRLLRNFTRDRGNQITLGAFLATFVYVLLVLRSVRSDTEGGFVPQISVSIAIAMAIICVAALVWFVDHMAGRINVDTVVSLVSRELHEAFDRLTVESPQAEPPPASFWDGAEQVIGRERGYLQQLDQEALADWAEEHGTAIQMLRRPGDYVFPNVPIALALPLVDGVDDAIVRAIALGEQRTSTADLEFAVRQLVEVALRALSPGINDPYTAITVIDRLGAALCELSRQQLPTGVSERNGRPVLVVPAIDFAGLMDAMLHGIRQSAAANPAVLIRMLEMLRAVAAAEGRPERVNSIRRHSDLVLAQAERTVESTSDLEDIRNRHRSLSGDTDPPTQQLGDQAAG